MDIVPNNFVELYLLVLLPNEKRRQGRPFVSDLIALALE